VVINLNRLLELKCPNCLDSFLPSSLDNIELDETVKYYDDNGILKVEFKVIVYCPYCENNIYDSGIVSQVLEESNLLERW
jgi:Zn-finger nucleic acid-binding protein